MAYDLQEQDQLDAFKAFWKTYGNLLLTVVTVVLLAIAGWRGWAWWEHKQSVEAAGVYDELRAAFERKDIDKVKLAAGTLFEKYPGTVYGSMGALLAARAHHDAGDLRAARAPLEWAVANAKDPDHRMIARLRLAGVLLDEKSYEDGLKVLAVAEPAGFAGSFADRRGDLLLAQGKRDEARAAYRDALGRLEPGDALRPLVQLKLDALGGA